MKALFITTILFTLAGCVSSIPYKDHDYTNDPNILTHPDKILLTEGDITDRPYKILKDLKLGYNKTTLFHDDPTPAHINAQLKHEAALLGADAVILVRYGTVGIGLASWGKLEGSGRAVKFVK